MTKADILDGLEELNVCNSYKINGEAVSRIPFQMNKMAIEAAYKTFKGWNTDITNAKSFAEMPGEMDTYINYLNEFLKVPVKYISNGPEEIN
jgi:adenylosuccinate synthase